MPKAAHDWDLCQTCTHSVNIHTSKTEIGKCRAYECECQEYVKK